MLRSQLMSRVAAALREDDGAVNDASLESLHNGSAHALAALYDSYSRLVYSIACRIVGNTTDAEDVVQDVFLQVWRRPLLYDPARGSLRNWIATISRTRSLDRLRRRQVRKRFIDTTDAVHALAPEPARVGGEQSRQLRDQLARLPATQRLLLDLAFYEGFTHVEIADLLGLRLGTVKSRLRTALRRLRDNDATGRVGPPAVTEDLCEFVFASRQRVRVLAGRRVLVVHSDSETVDVLSMVFSSAGATVATGASCAAALRRLRASWPDVVVADIRTAGRDDFALLHLAREIATTTGQRLCAIALTSAARQPQDAIFSAGFHAHLCKPVQPQALIDTVAMLAGGGRCER